MDINGLKNDLEQAVDTLSAEKAIQFTKALLTSDASEQDKIQTFINKYPGTIEPMSYIFDPRLLEQVKKASQDEEHKEVAEEILVLKRIFNPIYKKLFELSILKNAITQQINNDDFDAEELAINRINQVKCLRTSISFKGHNIPALRVLFANYRSEQLHLDTTMDWDDAIFILHRIIDNLNDQIMDTKNSLSDEGMRELLSLYSDNLLSRMKKVKQFSDQIIQNISNAENPG